MSSTVQSALFDSYGLPARHVEQEPSPALPAPKWCPAQTARGGVDSPTDTGA